MYQSNKGYLFEIKKNLRTMQMGVDANGNQYPLYGVKEEFNISFKGSVERVSLTFGLDGAFNIMKPAYYDVNVGLRPLSTVITSADVADCLNKFKKSNRATYSVCPTLICTVVGKLDRSTGTWLKDTRCNFYVQRNQSVEVIKDKQRDCVICDLYSSVRGIHTFCSNTSDTAKAEAFKLGLENHILSTIKQHLDSKEAFWLSRLK